jgi:hypothetical protein
MKTDVAAWLSFISTSVWQVMIMVVLWYLRGEIVHLLKNLVKVKVKDLELAFQPPSPEAKSPEGEAATELSAVGPGGFLTAEGIRNLVASSGHLDKDEQVGADLLIFSTERQHTWLIATDKKLFCLLDDDNTRTSGKIIQWITNKGDATPVVARKYKETVGLLDVGQRKNWLYSSDLFPTPKDLEREVTQILKA